jgi:hypothetical protein
MRKLLIFAMVLLILVIACDEENNGNVFPDYSTPVDTFETFVETFQRFAEPGIIGILKNCLTEDFTFYFDPNDEDVPVSLDKTAFCDACQNMFEQAYGINFEFTSIGSPGEGETEYDAETDINFILWISEINAYQATGAVYIIFNEMSGQWKIDEIRDQTASDYVLIIEPAPQSFGSILFLFY